jgi:hypothetical protein
MAAIRPSLVVEVRRLTRRNRRVRLEVNAVLGTEDLQRKGGQRSRAVLVQASRRMQRTSSFACNGIIHHA